MKLSPTEIFEGKKIFFMGGKNHIGRNAEITMLYQPINGLCSASANLTELVKNYV